MTQFEITLGFMPLTDSAILIAARDMGFAEAENIDLTLVRETSWANIRDRVALGHFQGAHMLAPMPIAANLGLSPLATNVIAPMALGLGGNAVTVSNELFAAMAESSLVSDLDPAAGGAALRAVIQLRQKRSMPPLRFAVVHPFSGHNYELRYWLSASAIDPETDIEIVIVPPPLMADALETGVIDGYCVGEPWNTVSVSRGSGHILTVKAAIWHSSPEKVLGLSQVWANSHPDAVEALLRALYRAAQWCGVSDNFETLAKSLSSKQVLNVPVSQIIPGLAGLLAIGDGETKAVDSFFVAFDKGATFPWQSHALWFYSQMVRWGHVAHSVNNALIARDSYRPDLYRRALTAIGAIVPGANLKVEGALKDAQFVGATPSGLILGPDGFFDGQIFDPDRLDDYIALQKEA